MAVPRSFCVTSGETCTATSQSTRPGMPDRVYQPVHADLRRRTTSDVNIDVITLDFDKVVIVV